MGDVEKPAVVEAFNRTWRFFPRQVAEEKKKVIAVQPISLHVQTFHGWHGVIFIFWFFDPIDERRRLFSDGKFGMNDSTSRFLIFVWAVLYDTFFICVIIVTPVTIECFRNQCESFRNRTVMQNAWAVQCVWCPRLWCFKRSLDGSGARGSANTAVRASG